MARTGLDLVALPADVLGVSTDSEVADHDFLLVRNDFEVAGHDFLLVQDDSEVAGYDFPSGTGRL